MYLEIDNICNKKRLPTLIIELFCSFMLFVSRCQSPDASWVLRERSLQSIPQNSNNYSLYTVISFLSIYACIMLLFRYNAIEWVFLDGFFVLAFHILFFDNSGVRASLCASRLILGPNRLILGRNPTAFLRGAQLNLEQLIAPVMFWTWDLEREQTSKSRSLTTAVAVSPLTRKLLRKDSPNYCFRQRVNIAASFGCFFA